MKSKIKKHQTFYILLGITLTVLLCNLLVCRVAFVYGESMEPTLSEHDCVLVWKLGYSPKKGDIVMTNQNNDFSQNIVKRVIAVEGQVVKVDENVIFVDGVQLEESYLDGNVPVSYQPMEVKVPEGKVFLMGDNRNASKDSREVGCFSNDSISGKVIKLFK